MRHVDERQVVIRMTRPRLRAAATAAVMLATAAGATACGGGGGVSIAERNAKASPAVAYQSGAAFVEALKRAGVSCPQQTITPVTAPTPQGTTHEFDSVTCTYSKRDYVNVRVAVPSELGRKYYSFYIDAHQKSAAASGSKAMILKGKYWDANGAPNDQRLFDIQKALGGQLLTP